MYIEAVPNRNSPPAILLRESYRDDGKVKKRTLLNLTDWPPRLVEGLRALLKGGRRSPPGKARDHHKPLAAARPCRRRARDPAHDRPRPPARARRQSLPRSRHRHDRQPLIAPASKLATAKALDRRDRRLQPGRVLGLGAVDEDELYTALDWLLERQPQIEAALAQRHLKDGTLVLYDVSSSYLEGRCCELASVRL